ncbi:MAG: glycerol-3-phosphate acyltransferase [Candidatus Kapaibacteriota bacterium]
MWYYFLVAIVSYLVGAIPFSYLISKWFAHIDLRTEGSKNLGARNSYEVTQNKWIGLSVLLLDILKGLIPAYFSTYFEQSIDISLFALLFCVFGHNYSIYLKFKGGRGLATAAGGFLYIAPLIPFVWIALYFIISIIKDNVHFKSIVATFLTMFIISLRANIFFEEYNFQGLVLGNYYIYFALAICFVILSKHWFYFNDLLKK